MTNVILAALCIFFGFCGSLLGQFLVERVQCFMPLLHGLFQALVQLSFGALFTVIAISVVVRLGLYQ